RVLEDNGLAFNVDYKIIAVGSGPARLESMKAGTSVAGVLSAPNDIEAERLGFNILADTVAALGSYQATVFAPRRSCARANKPAVLAFLRAAIGAADTVFADRPGSIELLQRHMRGVSVEQAASLYAELTSGKGGFNRKAAMNMAGVRTVLDIRSRYA